MQFLRQAEIDVLGIHFNPDHTLEIYGIDVAFHGDGLIYGRGKEDTTAIVVKKILRIAMCIRGFFGYDNAQILFAAPKINPAVLKLLEPAIEDAKRLLAKNNMENYNIKLFANKECNEGILKPVLVTASQVADTSELFVRSLQLYNLFVADD